MVTMDKYLTTQEMKEYILNKARLSAEDKILKWDFNIYFEKANKNKLPGKYIYSGKKGYYNVDIGDRGGIVCKRHYTEMEELSYDLYKFIVWLCAGARNNEFIDKQYEIVNKSKIQLQKEFELEVLKKIDIEYYYRYRKELFHTLDFTI